MSQCFQCGSRLTEFERSSPACAHCLLETALESPPEAEVDDSFGSYEIICQIGQGGMGIVYLAEQKYAVHREVALKVLKAGLDTAAVLGRFETERQALALMEHPNIARLYDAGRSRHGRPYFVMEFVDGLPITAACDQHGCSIPERLAVFVEVCHAIEHAHRKGIVHRDIKPSNVLVTEFDGHLTPKVIDFGIARAATGHLTGHTVATGFGELLGTPEYMSPEQAGFDSRAIGPRSDIYSLGVLLYEMLVGVLPFDPARLRESGLVEGTRILREEEAPSPLKRLAGTGQMNTVAACRKATPETLRRLLSRDLAGILQVCLQKDPQLRYPSVAALADDIGHYQRGEPLSAHGPTLWSRARQWLWRYRVALGGMATAALTATLVLWLSYRPSLPVMFPTIRFLTSYTGTKLQPSFSPDGKQFAFAWDADSGNFDIYVRAVEGGSPVRLTFDPALDLFPAWSPDGRQVAFIRVSGNEKALYVVPAHEGGQEREITTLSPGVLMDAAGNVSWGIHQPGPAWSPDGKSIVIADSQEQSGPDALYEVPLDGGRRWKLTTPEANSGGDAFPTFSPDGRALAFVRNGSSRGYDSLYVLDHGSSRLVLSQSAAILGLSWLSNQDLLFSSDTLRRLSIDGGRPSPILGAARGITSISYSARARGIAYVERHLNTNVWRIRMDRRVKANPEKLLFSSFLTESADYSPDGGTIVFSSNRTGGWGLWSAKGNGTDPVQLTPETSQVPFGTPRWSPDGHRIVYDTVRNGHSVIGIMDQDGRNAHVFASDPWDDMMPSWSHDGRSIYFTCDIKNALQVCRKPVAGGDANVLTTLRGGRDPRESPDGRFVFYEGAKGIWKVSANGGGQSAINGLEDVNPQRNWTIAGNEIYFLRNTLSPWTVYRYDLKTHRISAVATIAKRPVFGSPSMSVSPDLSYLLFSQTDERGTNIVMLEGISPK